MIPLAFYAPMKPPDHPVPSGDRTMARALLDALRAAGTRPVLASRFVSREAKGDKALQAEIIQAAALEVDRITPVGKTARWRAWITYHNYYKAPDLIGPAVARRLGIPYLLVEATRARKRLDGPWAPFAHLAEAACDSAAAIFFLTSRDGESLRRDTPPDQRLIHLRPFLPFDSLPRQSKGGNGVLCVGMMREGDKLASYRLVAAALAELRTPDWRATLVGAGPARAEVEALMRPFGHRVRFEGEKTDEALDAIYHGADVLLWPGVNEAFGMVYLEAQARGVPVVAQDRPGVHDVLAKDARDVDTASGAAGLAAALDRLLADPALRIRAGASARAHVEKCHLRHNAAALLSRTLGEVIQ